MVPIRIVLVDDNQDAIEIIQFFIGNKEGFEIVGICRNGEELIDEIIVKKPDLILADINMPKKNGLDAVKECLSFYPNLKFIFITGYDEFAISAFRMAAVDYIVKPVEKERLYKALEKAVNIIQYEQGSRDADEIRKPIKNLVLRDQNCIRYIPHEDIYFVEKSGKKCFVFTAEDVYETAENISRIYEKLDDSFYSAHRSYIINLKKVSHIIPHHETYIAYFHHFDKHASISKLKINEVRDKIASL